MGNEGVEPTRCKSHEIYSFANLRSCLITHNKKSVQYTPHTLINIYENQQICFLNTYTLIFYNAKYVII